MVGQIRTDVFENGCWSKWGKKSGHQIACMAVQMVGTPGLANLEHVTAQVAFEHCRYANKERRVKGPKPKKASEDGWEFGACLMMGGPGVGKTTTAHLVCRELGYEVIELNASDTRSRKSLKETVDTLLGNTTVVQFFTKASTGQKVND